MNDDISDISDEEIKDDIAITEEEIFGLEHDLKIAQYRKDRWGVMKAEVGIKQRKEFIEKLKNILLLRQK